MEKEKEYLAIIDKLVGQGYEKSEIDLLIQSELSLYATDEEIYRRLAGFLLDDFELNDPFLRDNSYRILTFNRTINEGVNISVNMDTVKNYDKIAPVYLDYVKKQRVRDVEVK